MVLTATVHLESSDSSIAILVLLLIALTISIFVWGVRNKGRLPEWPFFVQGSMAALSALALTVMDTEAELCGYCAIVCLLMYLMGFILVWVNRK